MMDPDDLAALAWDVEGRSTWRFRSPDLAGIQIRESAGCNGLGVFALHAVQPGERLLAERPLLEWSKERDGDRTEELEAAVALLREKSRRAYWALCQNAEHGKTKHAYGIWLSNALPTEDEPATAAVFRVASRLNHSCRPNAHINWNSKLQRITVHALTPIASGEEVRIHYRGGGDGETRDERQAGLRDDFGFVCACKLCADLDDKARAASDARQTGIASLFTQIAASPTPRNLVQLVEKRLALMSKEGVLTSWDTLGAAATYLQCTGDPQAASRWAARAAASAAAALGRDSSEFAQYVEAMGGLEAEWLHAGAKLQKDGYAILDGFAGESAARELRAELSVLYATSRAKGGGDGADSEFSRGEVGGGRDGNALDLRKDADVRGDERSLVDVNDPRCPSLRGLFFLCDQFVGMLAARNRVPELRAIVRRSRPMLACYAGNGAKYIRHVDNPDGNGRLLTCLYYLNAGWRTEHGGELVLYPAGGKKQRQQDERRVAIEPVLDRLVVFWSDARTPHEVLPAHATRLAVSSWYHTS